MAKTVVAFGAFDLIHPGHLHYLEDASRYGNLIVVVARDSTISDLTGKKPFINENARLEIIKAIKFVHTAVLGEKIKRWNDFYDILRIFDPDYIALGYDQKVDIGYLKRYLRTGGYRAKIVRIKPYHSKLYNTSRLERWEQPAFSNEIS
ncbi:MAG: FAD synthase [Candidatus Micrarchaeota archaeon]|nr:FAD synthase [Candidatus Micrarchaeota archaeon]MDE1833713.1 FAD synthase [Candidatus Micrarchaeota archaeon]MDE1859837.1 FAD synthase [Candidatus Micrarchaeota archaeon]